jgi:TP901 family phage tail tape measure protein
MADTKQNIIIDIKAETTKATNEIKRLNKEMNKLQKQVNNSDKSMKRSTGTVKKMGASFKTLTQHLSRLVVIYGSFQAITGTVTTFADFEQSLTNLGTISGATGEELKKLEEKALALGDSTVFSASQVVDGMTEMARAGLSAEQQLQGISSVLNLSINGMVDLKEATTIAVNAMNGFGLEADDMGNISDVLTQSINNSAQGLGELGAGLAKVAPVAKATNVSLEETVAVLGVLADAGRKGAEGGTQLKISLLRLGSNPEATKYLDELGVSMYDLDTKKILPLTERLELLKKKLATLDQQTRETYKTRIFGTEALASANIMMESIDKIKLKTELMQSAFGIADANARKMMDTLAGSYKQLLSALEGLQLKIANGLSPALRAVIEDTTLFIRELDEGDIEEFSKAIADLIGFMAEMGKATATIITVFADMSSGVAELVGGINGAMVVGGVLMYKLRKLFLAFSLLAPELKIIGIAIMGVIYAFERYRVAIEKINDSTERFTKRTQALYDILDEVVKKGDKLTQTELRGYFSKLGDVIENDKKLLVELNAEKAKLEEKARTNWFGLSNDEVTRLKTVKEQINVINDSIEIAMKHQKKLSDEGKRITEKRRADIKRINEANSEGLVISEKARELEVAQQEELAKTTKAYETKKRSIDRALDAMLAKEQRLNKQLLKLEDELAKKRQENANERLFLTQDYENRVADIKASELSDLEKYNDAQMRAETALANARKALDEGRLSVAEKYYQDAEELSRRYTASEIKDGDTVLKTKKQINAELLRDEKANYDFSMKLLTAKQQKEENDIKTKIALKENEIQLQRKLIELQIEASTYTANILAKLSGIKYDEQFNNFKKNKDKIDVEIQNLLDKRRELSIDTKLKTHKAQTEYKEFEKTVAEKPVTTDLELDTDEAEGGFSKFEATNTKTGVTVDLLADTEPMETEFDNAKQEIENDKIDVSVDLDKEIALNEAQALKTEIEATPIIPKANLDTSPALSQNNALVAELSKPVYKTVYVKTVQTSQTGGEILPRFNTGGNVDGHTRRTGKLNGYGGGDKVKALLEAGEFIIRKEAVKALGLDRLYQINQGRLPKYQTGGEVGKPALPRFNTGGAVTSTSSGKVVELNLNMGGQTFKTTTDEEVATQLANYLKRSTF